MAFFKPGLSIFLLVLHGMLFLSHPMHCNDDEDKLFQEINTYRQSLKLVNFTENEKAACLADKIADGLKDKPCDKKLAGHDYSSIPGTEPKFANFEKLLDKCDIDATTTKDGVILPACAPRVNSTESITNYTKTEYAKFIKNSNYSGAAVGSKHKWIVVILTTASSDGHGTFSGAVSLVANISMANCMVALLLALLLLSVC